MSFGAPAVPPGVTGFTTPRRTYGSTAIIVRQWLSLELTAYVYHCLARVSKARTKATKAWYLLLATRSLGGGDDDVGLVALRSFLKFFRRSNGDDAQIGRASCRERVYVLV